MSNEEKLQALKAFLTENKVKFIENYKSHSGVVMDLKLPKYMVAVRVGEDRDFYYKVFRIYNPFFIRESESVEFVIEKMQNCLTDIMVRRQKRYERKQKKAAGMKIFEENQKRHEEKLAARAAKEANKPRRKRQRIVRYEKV